MYFFGYKAHSVIRRTPNFSSFFQVSKLDWLYGAAAIFGDFHFNCNNRPRFPTMLITAIRLCEQKRERLRISIKGKKITPINTRALFSKAANWNSLLERDTSSLILQVTASRKRSLNLGILGCRFLEV